MPHFNLTAKYVVTFFIVGWATTIIHSKKTLKLLPQHVDFYKEIIQSFRDLRKQVKKLMK